MSNFSHPTETSRDGLSKGGHRISGPKAGAKIYARTGVFQGAAGSLRLLATAHGTAHLAPCGALARAARSQCRLGAPMVSDVVLV